MQGEGEILKSECQNEEEAYRLTKETLTHLSACTCQGCDFITADFFFLNRIISFTHNSDAVKAKSSSVSPPRAFAVLLSTRLFEPVELRSLPPFDTVTCPTSDHQCGRQAQRPHVPSGTL